MLDRLGPQVWQVRERIPARGPLQYMLTSCSVETDDFLSTRVERIESVRGEDIPLRVMLNKGSFHSDVIRWFVHRLSAPRRFLILFPRPGFDLRFDGPIPPPCFSSHSFLFLEPFVGWWEKAVVRTDRCLTRRSNCLIGSRCVHHLHPGGFLQTVLPNGSTRFRPSLPMPPLWTRSNCYARWHASTGMARMARMEGSNRGVDGTAWTSSLCRLACRWQRRLSKCAQFARWGGSDLFCTSLVPLLRTRTALQRLPSSFARWWRHRLFRFLLVFVLRCFVLFLFDDGARGSRMFGLFTLVSHQHDDRVLQENSTNHPARVVVCRLVR